ncbi:MAG: hypothetical protein ACOY3F_02675 [Bacillota bacterium]
MGTLVTVAVGLLWGASPLVFCGQDGYVRALVALLHPRPVSAVADLLRADNMAPWIWLMYVPKAVSTDAVLLSLGVVTFARWFIGLIQPGD